MTVFCRRTLGAIGIIIIALGCQRRNEIPPDKANSLAVTLLQQAKDTKALFSVRLQLASQADSIAVSENDQHAHLKSLESIASLYLQMDSLDSAKNYFVESARVAEGLRDVQNQGVDLNAIGLIYHEQGEYENALKYYTKAVQAFRTLRDTLRIAQALVNVSMEYKNQGYFERAISSGVEASHLLESVDAKNTKVELGSIYTILGNILREVNRLDDALEYHTRAINLQIEARDSIGIAGSLNNIGNVYRTKKQYRTAIEYYMQSLKLKEDLGRAKSTGTILNNIAEAYIELRELDQAKLYILKALKLGRNENKDRFITITNRLARLYLLKNEYREAESIAIQVLLISPTTGLLRQRIENNMILSDINGKLKRPAAALAYLQEGVRLKDSLFSSEMAEAVSRMSAQFKTKELALDLKYAQRQREVQSHKVGQQRIYISVLASMLVVLVGISTILYYTNKSLKRAKKRIEVLMAELDHRVRNNLQLIGDILAAQISVIKEPRQAAMLLETRNRVQSIRSIHTLLHETGFSGTIDIRELLLPLIENLSETYGGRPMRLYKQIETVQLPVKSAVSLGLIVNELLTNLYKHAACDESASVTIRLHEDTNNCVLQISDTCANWDMIKIRETRNGFGLLLVDTLARQLHGTWDFKSISVGSIQTITFKKTM